MLQNKVNDTITYVTLITINGIVVSLKTNLVVLHSMCMLDIFHLTFNFKSKVSRDVFFLKINKSIDICISFLKCHLSVTCRVIRVILIFDVWIFSSHVMLIVIL